MRGWQYQACAVASLATAGASSAAAANWDPPNTAMTAELAGGSATVGFAGAAISCNSIDTSLTAVSATQSVAKTNASHNPVRISNCSSGFLGTMTATTFGTWSFTASSTTSVTVQASNGASPVGQLTFHAMPACTITVPGFDIPNNTWSNASHNLTISSATIPVTSSAGCLGLFPSPMRLSGTLNAPAASIT